MKKTMSNFLFGFLAGAAAGAVAGILFSPDKGSKTRQNIRKKVREISDKYNLGLEDLMEEIEMETEPEIEVEFEPTTKIPRAKRGTKTSKPPAVAKRKYTRKPKPENS